MTEPAELFVKLTCEIEDLHGLAVEGHSNEQPDELLSVFAIDICNGLQRGQQLLRHINHLLAGRA